MSAYSAETYNYFIQDLKSIEKTIQGDLKELKINAGTNVNTFNTENSVRKGLENYLSKVNKTNDDYKKNSMDIKYTIPEREYTRRVNEILELKNNYERIKSEFDSFLDIKYKYVSLIYKILHIYFSQKGGSASERHLSANEDTDQTRNLSNRQILEYSQKKLKDQDNQIDDLIGFTRKGKELGTELQGELKKQNVLLDDVEKDVRIRIIETKIYLG